MTNMATKTILSVSSTLEQDKIHIVYSELPKQRFSVYKSHSFKIILGPVYDNEKENWRILTGKEIYAIVKKSTIT
jgi:hypothetical protein